MFLIISSKSTLQKVTKSLGGLTPKDGKKEDFRNE
jgi:hypothetical protein